ncbi:hypothetical protein D3C71_1925360 [compost metagenome]
MLDMACIRSDWPISLRMRFCSCATVKSLSKDERIRPNPSANMVELELAMIFRLLAMPRLVAM